MTCAQMGGMCDAKISGSTQDEMIANGMKHLEEAHPEMAANIKATPKEDPKMVEWSENFKKEWANTPDDK